MLKKLTKKGKDSMEKVKAGKGTPLYPIDECMMGCAARCNPCLPLEDSAYCNGEVCLLIF
ncbi:MAG: hypothetical protein NT166_21745 [Candidatus Aminicenantes bacterium]|nr:hypothetical protein [Candidatus Aminicenantes bacterium]